MTKLHKLHFDLQLHSPCSSDLEPASCSPNLKRIRAVKKFGAKGGVVGATGAYFEEKLQQQSYYKHGRSRLEDRNNKIQVYQKYVF